MYEALVRREYPPTGDDKVFGHIVSSCWNSSYSSIGDVEAAIKEVVGMSCEEGSAVCLSQEEHDACVRKCQEFLDKQGQELKESNVV